jgi:putative transcriptional regulator
VLAAATVLAATAPSDPIQPRAFLAGRLLVADESMDDPRFTGTVILMVAHDEGGAFGLVVNRPLGRRPFRELLQGLGDKDAPSVGEAEIHYGGPVEPLRGYVLHGPDHRSPATRDVNGFTVMTPTLDVMRLLARGEGPRSYLIAFGYAGWAPGQLEGEIAAGAWSVIDADAAFVFGKDHAGKWQRARARRGVDL